MWSGAWVGEWVDGLVLCLWVWESGGTHGVCGGQRQPSEGGWGAGAACVVWEPSCCGDGVEAHISCHAGLSSPAAA
jgi:hypothetical protein